MLEVIYVTRHGFSPPKHNVDLETGIYSSTVPSPTGNASDPALAGYGVDQCRELAAHLVTLSPAIERFYSSPFYRCVQTIEATTSRLQRAGATEARCAIRGDAGLGEWFGTAPFAHPAPADPAFLKRHFATYDAGWESSIVPAVHGETVAELHDRVAYALHRIVERSDAEGVRAIVLCTHAATLYAIGRALTGRMPEDIGDEDFRPFACGLSSFVRRMAGGCDEGSGPPVEVWKEAGSGIPRIDWRGGKGVKGGWDCVVSGDCSFLSGGEERGW
ncbi:MAG: hypothetical protein M1818_005712 [Claussenomyces sp. TS43310]|nr:MAG: hypothetical protein M1818_005712 [Claussenomyces sp. TS43310]